MLLKRYNGVYHFDPYNETDLPDATFFDTLLFFISIGNILFFLFFIYSLTIWFKSKPNSKT